MGRTQYRYGFLPTLIVMALGVFPDNCGVRWVSQAIEAALSAEQRAICAGTDSLSSGAIYRSIPESDIVAADSPAALTITPPVLCICEATLFHPDDFKSESKSLSSANGSGSENTPKAKFCPANGFDAAINLSCCSGDNVLGSLNFFRASCASFARAFASAARSFAPEISRFCSASRMLPEATIAYVDKTPNTSAPTNTQLAQKNTSSADISKAYILLLPLVIGAAFSGVCVIFIFCVLKDCDLRLRKKARRSEDRHTIIFNYAISRRPKHCF